MLFTEIGKLELTGGIIERGRPTTTLPIVLNRDLGLIDHFRLHSTNDLVKITELAKDRKQWRELSARIEKAAEASQTVNWDATRQ